MGKAAILLVAAAAIGGATLMLSAQLSSRDSDARQGEHRADVLAREAARSVHALVLDRIVDSGARTFTTNTGLPTTFAHSGGQASVAYLPDLMNRTADFTVSVEHSGAVHEIRSQYGWPQQFAGGIPAPVMLQSPWASMNMAEGSSIIGNRPVMVDQNPFTDLGLGEFLDINDMLGGISSAIDGSSSDIQNDGGLGQPCASGPMCGLDNLDEYLTDQGGMGLMELFESLLAQANDNPDRYIWYDSNKVFNGTSTYGSPQYPVIVHVEGGVAMQTPNSYLTGHGALIVEGDLNIMRGANFEWNGIVMVVSGNRRVEVGLHGNVLIRGALIGIQEGAPEGGHMDVTVWRDLQGVWLEPNGTLIETPAGWGVRAHAHTHRFDHATRGQNVIFARNGSGPHEGRLKFMRALNDMGTRNVYLEIGNPTRHGLTRFEVDVTGEGSFEGSVRDGWGSFAGNGASAFQSRPFQANRLRSLAFEIRSLRLLLRGFDSNDTCRDWPACISDDMTRKGALALRVRDASTHALLYDSGIYWHRKAEGHPENIQERIEEERWRESLLSGGEFGLNVVMGDNATIEYDAQALAGILQMAGLASSDGSIIHLASWTRHFSPTDVAAGRHLHVSPLAEEATTILCLDDRTISVVNSAVSAYMGRGARVGACG